MNDETNSDDIEQLVIEARAQRGGKPTKYVHLEKYSEIEKLVAADVQLPFILKWLAEEKKEKLVLNTLRKYVIFKIGRPAYEEYLKRNGWLKKKKAVKPATPPPVVDIQRPAVDLAPPVSPATKATPGQNPLRALSGTPTEGNHIPKAKFEID